MKVNENVFRMLEEALVEENDEGEIREVIIGSNNQTITKAMGFIRSRIEMGDRLMEIAYGGVETCTDLYRSGVMYSSVEFEDPISAAEDCYKKAARTIMYLNMVCKGGTDYLPAVSTEGFIDGFVDLSDPDDVVDLCDQYASYI